MKLHRVQVWFGSHLIIEHDEDEPEAAEYEAAMRRRFPGLRVTNEPVDPNKLALR
jgi:hypothetical protein